MDKIFDILKKTFGYEEFREHQKDIIESILNKKNIVAIMPTGSGKSLCYQIPALVFEGLTIVVSPLISLMKDQVLQLKETGVEAIFLNSTLSYEKYNSNIKLLLNKKVQLLYVAPETLVQERTINILRQIKVDLIAVDEAHCISEWGHDFRPEYRKLIDFRTHFPAAVTIALTATATPQVQKDIVKNLGISDAKIFLSSFDRKNLILEVTPKSDAFSQTVEFVQKFKNQSGLIYCFSRKQVDSVASELRNLGYSALPYHAGLSAAEREKNQEDFIKDNVRIIVATVAFGMGINKPDVRFVLHHDLPKNIESYYQQIGRAGRDGIDAHCKLLFSYGDTAKIKYFLNEKSEDEKLKSLNLLEALVNFCESEVCRRVPLLSYFGEDYTKDDCGKCDICLNQGVAKQNITTEAQKFLSCIKRTNESFGATHIIKILRGSKAKNVIDRKHNKLSTYGIGNDLSKKQWGHLCRQFIRKKIISLGEYSVLKLNKKSWEILRSKETVMGTLFEEKSSVRINENVNYDGELFGILRKIRKELSEEQNVPPYVIFTDKTLIDICIFYPQNKDSLIKMNGLGEHKVEKYGEILLEIINKYCLEKEIEDVSFKKVSRKKINTSLGKRHREVGEKFNSGFSLNKLCAEYKVKEQTIVQHLLKYKLEGNNLSSIIDVDLPLDEIHKIEESFYVFGTERLKPIFEQFDGKYSYETLRKIHLNLV
ncbi:MAG: DNA helicase RecQ [Candidatus Cloacimonadota bacterium]|nr:DNA helicase RecQ [Candidatus Cloacimonadota bacterium]